MYSVHEYDVLAKTKRAKNVKNVAGSSSKAKKPRKKTQRQLFVDTQSDALTNEDDLPLAVTFKKKKKQK